MRTRLLPCLLGLGLAAQTPTSSTAAFAFDPAKVPVGRVLRYTKSNRDGSHAIEVRVRVAGPGTLDVVKVENGGRNLARVQAEMDWTTFTVKAMKSWNRLESGEPNLQAEVHLDSTRHTYTATFNGVTAPAQVGHYPLVVYNFDFLGANFIWPFLRNPEQGVELGVADPDFAYMGSQIKGPGLHPGAFPYRGTATFRYVGEATHRGVPCRKFAVGGAAFQGREGTLLVNKAEGYWESFEHPQADNPAWTDFKFELVGVAQVSDAAWKASLEGLVAQAQAPEQVDLSPVKGLSAPDLLRQGLAAVEAQRWAEALRLLEAFTQGNPQVGAAWAALGDACYETRNYLKGAEAYRRASDLGHQPGTMRYYGAGCLALGGKREEALQALEAALALGYEDLPAALEEKDFGALRGDARFQALLGGRPKGAFDRTARWTHDLGWLMKELKRKHVHLGAKVDPLRLDAEAERLTRDLPTLTDAQVVVRMTQLLALVGDGHTALLPPVPTQFPYSQGMPLPELKLPALPLRFFLFPEGVRVVATTPDRARLLGARVVAVNGEPVAMALERLATTISRENPMWVKHLLPDRLQVPAILQALGLSPTADRATLTFSQGGREETLTLDALPADARPQWREAMAPALRAQRERTYAEEHLAAAGALVVRYNLCRKDKEAPAAFWSRVVREAEARKVNRFIVDLSANSGGNNVHNKPMVAALRGSEWLNQPGRLFVITGRATFSAGMNAAADLARETRATFVGEPTGSAPNFAGEASPVLLPFSGLRAFVASRYFQGADPTDRSLWIAPALRVEPSYEAWVAGKDQALEAVLALP
jgi:tetratricopeptide (TPR) repeat protein